MLPMSDAAVYEIVTRSPEETRDLGRRLGLRINSGIAIRLKGELGSGKTCFIQGLARGLDVSEAYDITSPTYTLIHQYPARVAFYHVDLYRLAGRLDASAIGLDDILAGDAVVAVEWADRFPQKDWPTPYLDVDFTFQDDESRLIVMTACGLDKDYLIKDLIIQS
jgi:tRNA threonylcarbamoyladenosine biosynthesis protein TsaE